MKGTHAPVPAPPDMPAYPAMYESVDSNLIVLMHRKGRGTVVVGGTQFDCIVDGPIECTDHLPVGMYSQDWRMEYFSILQVGEQVTLEN